MLEIYQNIPQKIDPIALAFGSFSVYWYSLGYLAAFLLVIALLYWRTYKKETDIRWNDIFDFLLYSFLAIIIGGRIGYVIFYNLNYFLLNPLEIIFPFNKSGDFIGIYGMSYYGGVLGFVLVTFIFCRKKKINFLKLTDFILPAIPLGYFFGRLGNFLNGELYGRTTTRVWGMDFGDGFLRHPSQLYEAFFEGVFLFFILWIFRNKLAKKTGSLTGIYAFGYGVFRFLIEFFREPDVYLRFVFYSLTMGQILSAFMIILGIILIKKSFKKDIL